MSTHTEITEQIKHRCADCGGAIGEDDGPPDGWQLEDSRTVCHTCCVADTRQIISTTLRGQVSAGL